MVQICLRDEVVYKFRRNIHTHFVYCVSQLASADLTVFVGIEVVEDEVNIIFLLAVVITYHAGNELIIIDFSVFIEVHTL